MTKRVAYFLVSAVLVGAVASPALADLNPGEEQVKDAWGAFVSSPLYVHGTPGWFAGGFGSGVSGTMSSAITGIGYAGTVMSEVFALANGGFGFAYNISLTQAPGDIDRITFEAIPSWANVRISTVYSAGDGMGDAASFVGWTDGDPVSINRDSITGHLGLDYLFGTSIGTEISGNAPTNQFASFYYEAPDLTGWSTSQLTVLNGTAGVATVFTIPAFTIPAPGAVVLGAIGLGAVGLVRRRFAR